MFEQSDDSSVTYCQVLTFDSDSKTLLPETVQAVENRAWEDQAVESRVWASWAELRSGCRKRSLSIVVRLRKQSLGLRVWACHSMKTTEHSSHSGFLLARYRSWIPLNSPIHLSNLRSILGFEKRKIEFSPFLSVTSYAFVDIVDTTGITQN